MFLWKEQLISLYDPFEQLQRSMKSTHTMRTHRNRFNRMKIWNIRNSSRYKSFSIVYWSSLQNAERRRIQTKEDISNWKIVKNFPSKISFGWCYYYCFCIFNEQTIEWKMKRHILLMFFYSVLCFPSTGAFRFSFVLFSQSIYKWNSKDAQYNTGANGSIDMIMHNNP